jgi:hypothetical protein
MQRTRGTCAATAVTHEDDHDGTADQRHGWRRIQLAGLEERCALLGQMGAQVGGFVGGTIGAVGQAGRVGPGWAGGALIGGGIGYAVGAGTSLAHDAVVGSGKKSIIGS